MIAEYALEPEMVATWGDRFHHRYFIREFGSGQGRLVSRYPKKWARKVWDSFAGDSEMERKRLEELLARMQETMIKRKDFIWDEKATWLANAIQEHARYPFSAVLARNNPATRPEILCEDELAVSPCPRWDSPHGITVNRKATEMAAAVQQMLTCCRWVKFIDPYISKRTSDYKASIQAFLNVLASERSVGLPERIEIHTDGQFATSDFLQKSYEKVIPANLHVTLFLWQERQGGQRLHNRFILTDLGGVAFLHGLDAGRDGETDYITRLDNDQYFDCCKQYDPADPAFEEAAPPLLILGTR